MITFSVQIVLDTMGDYESIDYNPCFQRIYNLAGERQQEEVVQSF